MLTDIEKIIYILGFDSGIIYVEENKNNEITDIILSGNNKTTQINKDVFFDLLYKYGYIKKCESLYAKYYQISEKGINYYNFKYPN